MKPLFSEGDILFVDICDGREFRVGDIVVFKDSFELVAHRIIKTSPQLVTKGDFSMSEESLDPNNIIGLVSGFRPSERVYNWGSGGQPLSAVIATFSEYSSSNHLKITRYLALISIIFLTLISKRLSG